MCEHLGTTYSININCASFIYERMLDRTSVNKNSTRGSHKFSDKFTKKHVTVEENL